MSHYTQEQIETANRTDLVDFLNIHGEKLKRCGAQYLWEKHQVWIRGNRWYTHYDSIGGYAIGFVMKYYAFGFQNAVAELLGSGTTQDNAPAISTQKPRELIVPEANKTMNRVYAYLMQERFIAREVISFFAHHKLLYEDAKYHNCIFVGTDEKGVPRHIHRRGTMGSFKQTETGSKADYSFHHNGASDWLFVFEAPIDMLAFITLHPENWQQHSYVALCSVSERAILHRLKVNPQLKIIVLCLDHDNAGRAACVRITGILKDHGYADVRLLHSQNKDWGEDTKAAHGVMPIRAEADETEAIRKLCHEFISIAKREKKPPQLLTKVSAVANSIQNKIPTVNVKQIDGFIVLLLLLSMDEYRKSLQTVTWDAIADKLDGMYVPHADNGNTEMRLRQICSDVRDMNQVYDIPSMFNDADIFVKPILKVAMDCIRLIHYLERKEPEWKESERY